MRAAAGDIAGVPPATSSTSSFRVFSSISLRRHQIASLEPSNEKELRVFDRLHSKLAESLQILSPTVESKPPSSIIVLSLPFLHKFLEVVLACESDFRSLLLLTFSQNPSVVSRPPLDRAIPDLLDRVVKSLDLCNAVSGSVDTLRLWNRHAEIAASALHCAGRPQISRARRALSKLVSVGAGRSASSSSCRRICSAKRHLQAMASSFVAPRSGESGSAALIGIAVHTVSSLLHFFLWVMVAAFSCSGGEVHLPPPIPAGARQMPWAAALARLHEKIVEEVRRERKDGGILLTDGMLAETVALGRSGREVLKMVENGGATEMAIRELVIATQNLEEGLGTLEGKVREVFHRLVNCREEVLRCLGNGSRSSGLSMDSL